MVLQSCKFIEIFSQPGYQSLNLFILLFLENNVKGDGMWYVGVCVKEGFHQSSCDFSGPSGPFRNWMKIIETHPKSLNDQNEN